MVAQYLAIIALTINIVCGIYWLLQFRSKDENVRWFARFMAPASLVGTIVALLILLFAGSSRATDYYACQNAQQIDGDNTWCTAAQRSGSCAATAGRTAWATVVADTPTLHANGCASIVIGVNKTIDAVKMTNKTDGTSTDGGIFNFTTSTGNPSVLNIPTMETGAASKLLYISGSGSGTVFTINATTITGGAGGEAICSEHSVGTVVVNSSDVIGGTVGGSYGLRILGTGVFTITSNITAGTAAQGLYMNAGTVVVNGDCVGGTAQDANGAGCANNTGTSLTVTGNIKNSATGSGTLGKVIWAPASAKNYIKYDGGGTVIYAGAGLGSDSGGTQISGANTAAEISTGKYFVKKDDGVYTQGSKTAGSGGSWVH
jgi:hypothetical protein